MDPIGIQKELVAMPEWERLVEIRQFSYSVQLFQQNANELIGLLESIRTGPMRVRFSDRLKSPWGSIG